MVSRFLESNQAGSGTNQKCLKRYPPRTKTAHVGDGLSLEADWPNVEALGFSWTPRKEKKNLRSNLRLLVQHHATTTHQMKEKLDYRLMGDEQFNPFQGRMDLPIYATPSWSNEYLQFDWNRELREEGPRPRPRKGGVAVPHAAPPPRLARRRGESSERQTDSAASSSSSPHSASRQAEAPNLGKRVVWVGAQIRLDAAGKAAAAAAFGAPRRVGMGWLGFPCCCRWMRCVAAARSKQCKGAAVGVDWTGLDWEESVRVCCCAAIATVWGERAASWNGKRDLFFFFLLGVFSFLFLYWYFFFFLLFGWLGCVWENRREEDWEYMQNEIIYYRMIN